MKIIKLHSQSVLSQVIKPKSPNLRDFSVSRPISSTKNTQSRSESFMGIETPYQIAVLQAILSILSLSKLDSVCIRMALLGDLAGEYERETTSRATSFWKEFGIIGKQWYWKDKNFSSYNDFFFGSLVSKHYHELEEFSPDFKWGMRMKANEIFIKTRLQSDFVTLGGYNTNEVTLRIALEDIFANKCMDFDTFTKEIFNQSKNAMPQ